MEWSILSSYVILLAASQVPSAFAIQCLQCTNLLERQCEYGTGLPQTCSPQFKFCIKYVGQLRQGKVVFRDCQPNNLTSQCTKKEFYNQEVRVCYNVCGTDGCNGGPITAGARSSLTVLFSKCLLAFLMLRNIL